MANLDKYYALLNIDRSASRQEIKEAYIRLAKQWHPDRFPYDSQERCQAEETFKAINEAYNRLTDEPGSSSIPASTQSSERSPASSSRVRTHQSTAQDIYEEAIAFANQDQVTEAIEALSQAIRRKPDFLKAYQYRAFLHEKLGHLHQATSDFETVKRLKAELVEINWKKPSSTSDSSSSAKTNANDTDSTSKSNAPTALTWTKIYSVSNHSAGVTDMTFNTVIRAFASSSLDGTITVWRPKEPQVLSTLETGSTPIYALQSIPKISKIVSAGLDGNIRFWDLRRMKISHTLGAGFDGHRGAVNALAISPNGQILTSGGQDQSLKLWSILSGSVEAAFNTSHPITSIAVSPHTHHFVSNGQATRLDIRRFPYGTIDLTLEIDAMPSAIAFNPRGTDLAVGYADGRIQLWSLKTQTLVLTMSKHVESITSLDFSSDGAYLLSSSEDKNTTVWNLSTGSPIVTVSAPSAILTSQFCLANDSIIGGDKDGQIHLWHLSQNR